MSAADDALLAQAQQYGEEIDGPVLRLGDTVNVRLFVGLTMSMGIGKLAEDDRGNLVMEVADVRPAARAWTATGAA